jgi:D-alanyl-D-alanine carboxypeptidase (penicillin-binding protein 5/6)
MKILFLAFFFGVLISLPLQGSSHLRVDVSAKGAVLMNAETGAVLWEKNARTLFYPSSTTKIITALYALEKKGHALDVLVTASHDAVATVHPSVRRAANGRHPPYRLEFGGTHIGIKAGEILSLRALLYGLMLTSGNVAANVIAEYTSGNVSAFMEELNRFVREKGCLQTVLHTPHGLPHPEHQTTAYDLGILACEAMRNAFFREVVRTTHYPRPQTNKQPESTFYQHNALVKPGRFFYPKATGVKTGYTLSGGYSIVAAAEDGERKLITVLLGCEKIEQRYKDAIALFEAGFNEKKVSRTLFSKGFDLFTCPVEGGKAPLQAYLSQEIILDYFPSEEPIFKTEIAWQPPFLPILADQKVAEMRILSSRGKIISSTPLFAVRAVEPTIGHQVQSVWKKIKAGIWNPIGLAMAVVGTLILAGCFYFSKRRSVKN